MTFVIIKGGVKSQMAAEYSTVLADRETVKRLLPWLVAVAFFMESLDTTVLNTAVPKVAAA